MAIIGFIQIDVIMYLDTIRERLRCREVGGEGLGYQNSKNGWVTNNEGFVNKWGGLPICKLCGCSPVNVLHILRS